MGKQRRSGRSGRPQASAKVGGRETRTPSDWSGERNASGACARERKLAAAAAATIENAVGRPCFFVYRLRCKLHVPRDSRVVSLELSGRLCRVAWNI